VGGASSLAVMPRSAWTRAAPIVALADRMGSVGRITIHHDAMDAGGIASTDQAARRLDSIRRYHTQLGWADIGYHYAIDPGGRIWSARPLVLQGAHVRDQNERNLGVMLMGNFMHERPTPAAVASLRAFVAMQARRFNVPPNMVRTHRELAPTECPGTHLQAEVDRGRRDRAPGFA